MTETWAERDLNVHLRHYAQGSDECERRQRQCLLCGDYFDLDEGVALSVSRFSKIRVDGRLPELFCICNHCYWNAEKIESEDDYEF